MIECYMPFRTSETQAAKVKQIAESANVICSWLIRFMCEKGLESIPLRAIKKAAKGDSSSTPRFKKRKDESPT